MRVSLRAYVIRRDHNGAQGLTSRRNLRHIWREQSALNFKRFKRPPSQWPRTKSGRVTYDIPRIIPALTGAIAGKAGNKIADPP